VIVVVGRRVESGEESAARALVWAGLPSGVSPRSVFHQKPPPNVLSHKPLDIMKRPSWTAAFR
jgi:hypothetical protein